jgi:adenosylcobinamide-GDP ribazoletransferase
VKDQFKIVMSAFMFFTRIRIPEHWTNGVQLDKTSIYLPFIGWVVGGISALIFYLLNLILPVNISILFSMISSILLTGAFHEDGFADVCDAFGGGWTKTKILAIMKDSRLGAFGAIGIFLMLLARFLLLTEISVKLIPSAIILAHSLSRLAAVSFIYTHDYVRENDDSKAKPVSKNISLADFLIACFFGLLPLVLFQNYWITATVPAVLFVKIFLARYFNKWIGGYTGDCLGAMQQLTEVTVYLTIILLPYS